MIIKRKSYSYSETVIDGVKYIPSQVSDTLHDTIGYTEEALGQVDRSTIGQTPTVKKKTRMVRNVISGIKGFVPKKKKNKKSK